MRPATGLGPPGRALIGRTRGDVAFVHGLARLPSSRKLRIFVAAGALLLGGGIIGTFALRNGAPKLPSPIPAPADMVTDASGKPTSKIEARIRLASAPFRVVTGAGFVWALTRVPNSAVWRIDPNSNEVVGKPTPLPVDGWDLAVGAGSVWVAPNGADGRLTRIDARSGRITARISGRPIYLGGTIAFGGGYVWTGNDDERYRHGSTVSKIDPRTNRVVGKPIALGSPQSLAYGEGALWDADHSGWLVKVDPETLQQIVRRRLGFGPHGVLVAEDRVYVADSHGKRLLAADPKTGKIRAIENLPLGPLYPAYGDGFIWSGSEAAWQGEPDDRVVRIDPGTLRIVESVHVGANVASVAFGFGSAWAALSSGEVVRISPPT